MLPPTMNKKDLKKRKLQLAHDVRNIREDYSRVLPEDIPDEVTAEINEMLAELKMLREQTEQESYVTESK